MALLEDIMSQLEDMGIGAQSWMDIGNIRPTDISGALQNYYGISEQNLPPHLFQGISTDMLKQGVASTYSPQIQATGQSMLSKLQQAMGGQTAKQAHGGFAESSQAAQFQEGAKDVYGKGMTDVITKTGQQRTQGLQSVQDILNQWRETAAGIAY